jgi:hypothetical protein
MIDGVLRVTFNPTAVGVYIIIVPSNCDGDLKQHNLTVVPGLLDTEITTSTIDDVTDDNTFKAGSAISFSLVGKDS